MNNYSRQFLFDLPLNIPKVEDKEITKAIYLVGSKSAFYAGHSALMLIDKEGKGTFYSTIFDIKEAPGVLSGEDAPFKLYKQELSKLEVEKYFLTGKIPGIDTSVYQMYYLQNYDKYIIIPVKDKEQGTDIYSKAEFIYKNPGKYNFYAYNCNHIIQDILEAGNANFTPSKADKEELQKQLNKVGRSLRRLNPISALYWSIQAYRTGCEMGVIPNGAFKRGVRWAKENNYDNGKINPKKQRNPLGIRLRGAIKSDANKRRTASNIGEKENETSGNLAMEM